jgi:hypothetical protein
MVSIVEIFFQCTIFCSCLSFSLNVSMVIPEMQEEVCITFIEELLCTLHFPT